MDCTKLTARISDASLALRDGEARFQRCRQSLLEEIFRVRQDRELLAQEAEDLSTRAASMASDTAFAQAAHQGQAHELHETRHMVRQLAAENAAMAAEIAQLEERSAQRRAAVAQQEASRLAAEAAVSASPSSASTSFLHSGSSGILSSNASSVGEPIRSANSSASASSMGDVLGRSWKKHTQAIVRKRIREEMHKRGIDQEGAANLFRHHDASRTGRLTSVEFKSMLGEIGCNFEEVMTSSLFEDIDQDRQGSVSFQEFMRFVVTGEEGGGQASLGQPMQILPATAQDSILGVQRRQPGITADTGAGVFAPASGSSCRGAMLICPICEACFAAESTWAEHVWTCAKRHGLERPKA